MSQPHGGRKPQTALCGAKTRSGGRCKHQAGFGTDHPGRGKCKLHGGNGGRPPKTGKYVGLPGVLSQDYLARLDDPTLKTLEHETALVEALIVDACRQASETGLGDWSKAADAFEALDAATQEGDKDGFVAAMAVLRSEIERGKGQDVFRENVIGLVKTKAALVEKGSRVEERAGLVVSARDFIGLIAWTAHYLGEVASRHNDPSIVQGYRAELVRKGAFAAGPDAGGAGSPSAVS